MAAFFIVKVSIPDERDRAPYDEYITKVKPIVESFGGEYLVRSEKIECFIGTWKPDRFIVIRFASKEKLLACFTSQQYRAVAGLREQSVQADAIIVED